MAAVVSERRQLAREADARIRSQATSDFRRLEADIEKLTEELGLRVALLWKGEGSEESVREVEAELDAAERELRRAEAAYSYVR
jgi:hypothetical protein